MPQQLLQFYCVNGSLPVSQKFVSVSILSLAEELGLLFTKIRSSLPHQKLRLCYVCKSTLASCFVWLKQRSNGKAALDSGLDSGLDFGLT